MIILATIAIYLLIADKVESQCTTGCQKCDRPNNACLYCDNLSKYIIEKGACIRVDYAECVLYSINGVCLQCSPNFFLSEKTNICEKVPADAQIANCLANSSATKCAKCVQDHFLKDEKCEPVPKAIEGCEEYKPDFPETCLKCHPAFAISRDQALCIRKQDPATCLYYKNVQCSKCKAGFHLDKNFYLSNILGLNSVAAREALKNWLAGNATSGFSDCRPTAITNCEAFADYKACRTCRPGFILTEDKDCSPFPSEFLPSCVRYKSSSICLECEAGRILVGNVCTHVKPIASCAAYNTTIGEAQCVSCKAGFFLTDKTTCTRRNLDLGTKCSKYRVAVDACEECDSKFGIRATDDGSKCLEKIPNCVAYEASNVFTTSLVCKTCIDNYSFNINIGFCERGSISNCRVYAKGNFCTECFPTYYLSNGLCVKQPEIQNCNVYSQNIGKTCSQCRPGFYLFNRVNQCTFIKPIANCEKWASPDTCAVCVFGFSKIDNACVPIDSSKFCQIFEAGKCKKCNPGHLLDEGLCTSPADYFTKNCAVDNINGFTSSLQYQCTYCKENMIPFNLQNYYVCTATPTPPVANCLKFSKNSEDKFVCERCKDGFLLEEGACFTTCSFGRLPHLATFVKTSASLMQFAAGSDRVCLPSSIANCLLVAPAGIRSVYNDNVNMAGEYVCVSCAANYVPVVGGVYAGGVSSVQTSSIPLNSASFDMETPLDVYPKFDCKINTGIVGTVNTTGFITNCEYYYYLETDQSKYGCFKCVHGFSGAVIQYLTNLYGYIDICAEILSCNVNVVYKGLTEKVESAVFAKVPMELFYSCHSCDSGKFPVTFISLSAVSFSEISGINSFMPTIRPFKIPTTLLLPTFIQAGSTGRVTQCLTITKLTFSSNFVGIFSYPANCGMFMVNTDFNAGTINYQAPSISLYTYLNIWCTACQPLYRVVKTQSYYYKLPFLIWDCELIPNCASSTWLNFCSTCSPNYVYQYNTNTLLIDFDICVLSNGDPNCYAISSADSTRCMVCKKGFFLNSINFCDKLKIPFCENQVFFTYTTVSFKTGDSTLWNFGRMLHFFFPESPGCNSCASGYASFKATKEIMVCVESDYVKTAVIADDLFLKTNCINYSIDNSKKYICKVCKPGFIISTTGNCFPNTQLSNCKIAYSATICDTCEDSFVFLNLRCVTGTVANCLTYLNAKDATTLYCSRCIEGYYSSGGALCTKGDISNCQIYDSKTICSQCAPGYQVATIKNSLTYCFQISDELKCLGFGSDFKTGALSCNACKEGFIETKEGNFPASHCLKFDQVENCIDYDSHSPLLTSTLKCRQCALDHYLNSELTCTKRTKIDKQCNYLHISQDKCLRCKGGYFIADNFRDCVANPAGIIGCQIYTSQSNCQLCREGLYPLNGTQCLPVEANVTIPSCKYYASPSKCVQCKDEHYLEEGQCVKSLAKDCAKWANKTACESCPLGKGFQKRDDVINCLNFTDPECLVSGDTFPFVCLKCRLQFYPDEKGVCVFVKSPIKNCLFYQAEDKCMICAVGFVLSIDKGSCSVDDLLAPLVDPNCEESQLVSPSVCSVCQQGYVFDGSGVCVKCNVTDWKSVAMCNPERTSEAIFCTSGFYQNFSNICVENPVVVGENNGNANNGNSNTNTTVKSALNLMIGNLMFVIILVLF